MSGDLVDGYPYELAGEQATPPTPAAPRIVELARRAAAAEDADAQPLEELYEVGPWRLARSIDVLRAEANAANPARDHSSDGTIGDTRHAIEGTSDHLPLIVVGGRGVVRALDLDVDGLDLPAAFERARALAHAGKLPQLLYLILNGRITAPDFSRWLAYKGDNPHVKHGHVSVSRDPARFDLATPWGIFTAPPPPRPTPRPAKPPTPAPQPAPAAGDLTGRGAAVRGDQGARGPRVAELQDFLNRYAPAYSHLTVDGAWGGKSSAVIAEFARRQRPAIAADGATIGPRIAAALYRAGFDRTARQQAVLRHLARPTRR